MADSDEVAGSHHPQTGSFSNQAAGAPATRNDNNAAFLRAARAGNLERVLEHLRNGTDINTCNSNGLNALHLASKEGHHEVVRELLNRGAIVDAATRKGNTALHIASLAGQDVIVAILVQNNANPNAQSLNGFTPLYMAAQENHENVVSYLLHHNANQALATEDGFTPLAVALQQGHDRIVALLLENDNNSKVRLPALHIAAKKDDIKAASLLLQNEQNADVTSKSGFTPLHIAAHYGNENVARLLLEKGAKVNYQARHNISPLHVAAKWGRTNLCNVLLANGAIIDCKTRDLLTPLHCAARSGHDQVVDLLLEKNAPIAARTKNGLAPLHMAAQGDHVECARILLFHRANVDDVTVDYLTPLHVAAHCGHVRVAKLLLDRSAEPNARALNGFTPLHIACKKNRIKVVELLLKYQAAIEATTESGLSPLHVASFMGCTNIVIFLIQQGANVDVETVRGETPLHLAARANQTDIVRVLVRNGAKVDAQARELQTPLHIAARLGNTDICMLLLQAGANSNAATKDLYTPLHIAAKEGQEEVAVILLDHKADKKLFTKKGFTPLHLACKYGNYNVAKLLLDQGTPVDIQGKNQVTPLHVAAHYNNDKVAQLLLENGASSQASAKNGYTPLHIAAKKNQMDIASFLLQYKADPNAESRAGFTPLHLASEEGHREMAALLMENGSHSNAKAKNGLTSMHLCAQEDRVEVAGELLRNNADVNSPTNAGYTPLHVACHFGQMNMVRFLIENGANIEAVTNAHYTPLHQAAQQGHNNVCRYLLDHGASPNTKTSTGQTPLSIAQRLGYVSVVETLKTVTETTVVTETTTVTEERYKPHNPEGMNETMFSDSEEEPDDNQAHTAEHAKDFNESITQGLRDSAAIHLIHTGEQGASNPIDNVDINLDEVIKRAQNQPVTTAIPDSSFLDNGHDDNVVITHDEVRPRGGAMRGCRHSGVRVIIPPRKAAAPMRITCRYLRKEKLAHPPPLSEGEALASRVLEMGPHNAKFLGPVILEVPHFASLRGREREIVILRSDDGQHWKEHQLEATEDAVQEVLNESFDTTELQQLDDLHTSRITRILTNDFPMYFAVVTRVRQEVHCVGPEGGVILSSVVPRVQAIFPDGSLTKTIKVSLQAQPVPQEIVAKLHGNRVAVSPIVTVEPRRRKFHKPITLCIPLPQSAQSGMINRYQNNQPGTEPPTLRLLCSITGGSSPAQWEDITGTTQLTFTGEDVSFTTTVSARFWLMDTQTPRNAAAMAQEVYNEAIAVPYMAKFAVFSRRPYPVEGQLRLFCMTDDKEDKTLEKQESFIEVAKSREVEVLSGRHQFLEFAGNILPVTKSGDQLSIYFLPFQENRLGFNVKVRQQDDEEAASAGRIAIMKEARVRAENIPPQHPICTLSLTLPDYTGPLPQVSSPIQQEAIAVKYSKALSQIPNDATDPIPIAFVARQVGADWPRLARALQVPDTDIRQIKREFSGGNEPINILKIWIYLKGTEATPAELQSALRRIGRDDIVHRLNKNDLDSEADSLRYNDINNLRGSNFSSKISVDRDYDKSEPQTSEINKTVTRTERYVHETGQGPLVAERTVTTTYKDDEPIDKKESERKTDLNDTEHQQWHGEDQLPVDDHLITNSRQAMITTQEEKTDNGYRTTTTFVTSHIVPDEEEYPQTIHEVEEEAYIQQQEPIQEVIEHDEYPSRPAYEEEEVYIPPTHESPEPVHEDIHTVEVHHGEATTEEPSHAGHTEDLRESYTEEETTATTPLSEERPESSDTIHEVSQDDRHHIQRTPSPRGAAESATPERRGSPESAKDDATPGAVPPGLHVPDVEIHPDAAVQKKEVHEEGYANSDGSEVVAKKMTRVITTSQSAVSGVNEQPPPYESREDSDTASVSNVSLGSVRDRIAIFESLKEKESDSHVKPEERRESITFPAAVEAGLVGAAVATFDQMSTTSSKAEHDSHMFDDESPKDDYLPLEEETKIEHFEMGDISRSHDPKITQPDTQEVIMQQRLKSENFETEPNEAAYLQRHISEERETYSVPQSTSETFIQTHTENQAPIEGVSSSYEPHHVSAYLHGGDETWAREKREEMPDYEESESQVNEYPSGQFEGKASELHKNQEFVEEPLHQRPQDIAYPESEEEKGPGLATKIAGAVAGVTVGGAILAYKKVKDAIGGDSDEEEYPQESTHEYRQESPHEYSHEEPKQHQESESHYFEEHEQIRHERDAPPSYEVSASHEPFEGEHADPYLIQAKHEHGDYSREEKHEPGKLPEFLERAESSPGSLQNESFERFAESSSLIESENLSEPDQELADAEKKTIEKQSSRESDFEQNEAPEGFVETTKTTVTVITKDDGKETYLSEKDTIPDRPQTPLEKGHHEIVEEAGDFSLSNEEVNLQQQTPEMAQESFTESTDNQQSSITSSPQFRDERETAGQIPEEITYPEGEQTIIYQKRELDEDLPSTHLTNIQHTPEEDESEHKHFDQSVVDTEESPSTQIISQRDQQILDEEETYQGKTEKLPSSENLDHETTTSPTFYEEGEPQISEYPSGQFEGEASELHKNQEIVEEPLHQRPQDIAYPESEEEKGPGLATKIAGAVAGVTVGGAILAYKKVKDAIGGDSDEEEYPQESAHEYRQESPHKYTHEEYQQPQDSEAHYFEGHEQILHKREASPKYSHEAPQQHPEPEAHYFEEHEQIRHEREAFPSYQESSSHEPFEEDHKQEDITEGELVSSETSSQDFHKESEAQEQENQSDYDAESPVETTTEIVIHEIPGGYIESQRVVVEDKSLSSDLMAPTEEDILLSHEHSHMKKSPELEFNTKTSDDVHYSDVQESTEAEGTENPEEYRNENDVEAPSELMVPANIPADHNTPGTPDEEFKEFIPKDSSMQFQNDSTPLINEEIVEDTIQEPGSYIQDETGERINVPHIVQREQQSTMSIAGSVDDRLEQVSSQISFNSDADISKETLLKQTIDKNQEDSFNAANFPTSAFNLENETSQTFHEEGEPQISEYPSGQFEGEASELHKNQEFVEEILHQRPQDIAYPEIGSDEEEKGPGLATKIAGVVAGITVGGAILAYKKVKDAIGGDSDEEEYPQESTHEYRHEAPHEYSHEEYQQPQDSEAHYFEQQEQIRHEREAPPSYEESTSHEPYEEEHADPYLIQAKHEHGDYSDEVADKQKNEPLFGKHQLKDDEPYISEQELEENRKSASYEEFDDRFEAKQQEAEIAPHSFVGPDLASVDQLPIHEETQSEENNDKDPNLTEESSFVYQQSGDEGNRASFHELKSDDMQKQEERLISPLQAAQSEAEDKNTEEYASYSTEPESPILPMGDGETTDQLTDKTEEDKNISDKSAENSERTGEEDFTENSPIEKDEESYIVFQDAQRNNATTPQTPEIRITESPFRREDEEILVESPILEAAQENQPKPDQAESVSHSELEEHLEEPEDYQPDPIPYTATQFESDEFEKQQQENEISKEESSLTDQKSENNEQESHLDEEGEPQISEYPSGQFEGEASELHKNQEFVEEPLHQRPQDIAYPESEEEKGPGLATKIAGAVAGVTVGGAILAYKKVKDAIGGGSDEEEYPHESSHEPQHHPEPEAHYFEENEQIRHEREAPPSYQVSSSHEPFEEDHKQEEITEGEIVLSETSSQDFQKESEVEVPEQENQSDAESPVEITTETNIHEIPGGYIESQRVTETHFEGTETQSIDFEEPIEHDDNDTPLIKLESNNEKYVPEETYQGEKLPSSENLEHETTTSQTFHEEGEPQISEYPSGQFEGEASELHKNQEFVEEPLHQKPQDIAYPEIGSDEEEKGPGLATKIAGAVAGVTVGGAILAYKKVKDAIGGDSDEEEYPHESTHEYQRESPHEYPHEEPQKPQDSEAHYFEEHKQIRHEREAPPSYKESSSHEQFEGEQDQIELQEKTDDQFLNDEYQISGENTDFLADINAVSENASTSSLHNAPFTLDDNKKGENEVVSSPEDVEAPLEEMIQEQNVLHQPSTYTHKFNENETEAFLSENLPRQQSTNDEVLNSPDVPSFAKQIAGDVAGAAIGGAYLAYGQAANAFSSDSQPTFEQSLPVGSEQDYGIPPPAYDADEEKSWYSQEPELEKRKRSDGEVSEIQQHNITGGDIAYRKQPDEEETFHRQSPTNDQSVSFPEDASPSAEFRSDFSRSDSKDESPLVHVQEIEDVHRNEEAFSRSPESSIAEATKIEQLQNAEKESEREFVQEEASDVSNLNVEGSDTTDVIEPPEYHVDNGQSTLNLGFANPEFGGHKSDENISSSLNKDDQEAPMKNPHVDILESEAAEEHLESPQFEYTEIPTTVEKQLTENDHSSSSPESISTESFNKADVITKNVNEKIVQESDVDEESQPQISEYPSGLFEGEASELHKNQEFVEEPLEHRPQDIAYPEIGSDEEEKGPGLATKIAGAVAGVTVGGAILAYKKVKDAIGGGSDEEKYSQESTQEYRQEAPHEFPHQPQESEAHYFEEHEHVRHERETPPPYEESASHEPFEEEIAYGTGIETSETTSNIVDDFTRKENNEQPTFDKEIIDDSPKELNSQQFNETETAATVHAATAEEKIYQGEPEKSPFSENHDHETTTSPTFHEEGEPQINEYPSGQFEGKASELHKNQEIVEEPLHQRPQDIAYPESEEGKGPGLATKIAGAVAGVTVGGAILAYKKVKDAIGGGSDEEEYPHESTHEYSHEAPQHHPEPEAHYFEEHEQIRHEREAPPSYEESTSHEPFEKEHADAYLIQAKHEHGDLLSGSEPSAQADEQHFKDTDKYLKKGSIEAVDETASSPIDDGTNESSLEQIIMPSGGESMTSVTPAYSVSDDFQIGEKYENSKDFETASSPVEEGSEYEQGLFGVKTPEALISDINIHDDDVEEETSSHKPSEKKDEGLFDIQEPESYLSDEEDFNSQTQQKPEQHFDKEEEYDYVQSEDVPVDSSSTTNFDEEEVTMSRKSSRAEEPSTEAMLQHQESISSTTAESQYSAEGSDAERSSQSTVIRVPSLLSQTLEDLDRRKSFEDEFVESETPLTQTSTDKFENLTEDSDEHLIESQELQPSTATTPEDDLIQSHAPIEGVSSSYDPHHVEEQLYDDNKSLLREKREEMPDYEESEPQISEYPSGKFEGEASELHKNQEFVEEPLHQRPQDIAYPEIGSDEEEKGPGLATKIAGAVAGVTVGGAILAYKKVKDAIGGGSDEEEYPQDSTYEYRQESPHEYFHEEPKQHQESEAHYFEEHEHVRHEREAPPSYEESASHEPFEEQTETNKYGESEFVDNERSVDTETGAQYHEKEAVIDSPVEIITETVIHEIPGGYVESQRVTVEDKYPEESSATRLDIGEFEKSDIPTELLTGEPMTESQIADTPEYEKSITESPTKDEYELIETNEVASASPNREDDSSHQQFGYSHQQEGDSMTQSIHPDYFNRDVRSESQGSDNFELIENDEIRNQDEDSSDRHAPSDKLEEVASPEVEDEWQKITETEASQIPNQFVNYDLQKSKDLSDEPLQFKPSEVSYPEAPKVEETISEKVDLRLGEHDGDEDSVDHHYEKNVQEQETTEDSDVEMKESEFAPDSLTTSTHKIEEHAEEIVRDVLEQIEIENLMEMSQDSLNLQEDRKNAAIPKISEDEQEDELEDIGLEDSLNREGTSSGKMLSVQQDIPAFRPSSPVPPAFGKRDDIGDEQVADEQMEVDSLNGESGSSGEASVIDATKKKKHTSYDNVSESSLQEFERLELELREHVGESPTSESAEYEKVGESQTGSISSLVEFENIEREVRENAIAQAATAEEVMMLSDIREESEIEEMSVREDDEEEEDSLSESKPPQIGHDERQSHYPDETMLTSTDSLEAVTRQPNLLETSTDSLEPRKHYNYSPNQNEHDEYTSDHTDRDSLLEGVSQSNLSQDTQMLSGDTVATYQEYQDDDEEHDNDSLTEVIESYPTTLTTFETVQRKDDGSVETISRRVMTRVTDPVHSRVKFTGTEDEQRLHNIPVDHPVDTVDEEGNVTTTQCRRTPT